MKFRRLNTQELEALREEFIQFLAANSIPAKDWENLKKHHPENAEQLIDVFSDLVWEKVLSKTNVVEIRRSKMLRIIKFGEEKAEMIQIAIQDPEFDFRRSEDINNLAEGRTKLKSLDPEIHRGKKTYTHSRNEEVFYHLEQGGIVAEENLWELMNGFVG